MIGRMHVQIRFEQPESLTESEVVDLYASVGWAAYTADPATLLRGLAGSHRIVTAREGGHLVGLARSISDGETIAYVQDILVRPDAHRRGIGRQLMTALLDAYRSVRQNVLLTDAEDRQRAFYEAMGFDEAHDMSPQLRAFVRLN
jgi:GNAT superfamily N-acetyltransferase